MPKWSELPTIVTAIAAFWGAGLSTFSYFAQRRRDQPALKVEIRDPEGDDDFHLPVIQVSAINVGHRDIRLKGAEITLESGEQLVTNDLFTKHDDLPCTLHAWKNEFTASITINRLYDLLSQKGYRENDLAELRGKLFDSTGKVYESPCRPYLVRNWKQKSAEEVVYEPIIKAHEGRTEITLRD